MYTRKLRLQVEKILRYLFQEGLQIRRNSLRSRFGKLRIFTVSSFISLLIIVLLGCTSAIESVPPTSTLIPTLSATMSLTWTSTSTSTPLPSPTPFPTNTPTPTETPIPATATNTPTPVPQQLLLREKCGNNYTVNPNEPIQIYYGGWAVEGKELAFQWSTAIVVELMIDEMEIDGVLQPESHELPNNCTTHSENIFWLYHTVVIPGLSAGEHTVVVTIKSLRAVADGSGIRFGPGTISRDKFYVTTR